MLKAKQTNGESNCEILQINRMVNSSPGLFVSVWARLYDKWTDKIYRNICYKSEHSKGYRKYL